MPHALQQQLQGETVTSASQRVEDGALPRSLPDTLPDRYLEEISRLPKLTREQCGHIRHIHNLVSQPDNDWTFMGADSGQEYDDAFRYQLSAMTYAVGAAHYHRLPALRSVFRSLIQKLIAKMLLPEVWGYWYLTSQSGKKVDPDLKELRKPWADPVCKENVMYSGHLLLMVSLYSMLFADDRYDKEDSIVFDWSPMWWGMGPERFSYTRMKLQKTILKEMESTGWIGACCEPNMVFIVCNQFPMIATRYNDVWNGTNIIDDVLAKYKKAWASRGMISENGLFRKFYSVRQDRMSDGQELSHSAWIMAFMPWNHSLVQSISPAAGTGYLQRISDRINIRPAALANTIKHIATTENLDPESPLVLERARQETSHQQQQLQRQQQSRPNGNPGYLLPTFGKVAMWLSEIAGASDLDPLLRHADRYLHPSWHNGGLYYARHDAGWDTEGNYTRMEPFSGNAGIAYARLNVRDGQKRMWDAPWTREQVRHRVCIEGVGLQHGVDFLRGVWVDEIKALVTTMRSWDGAERVVEVNVKRLPRGRYGVYIDGALRQCVSVAEGSQQQDVGFGVPVGPGQREVDVVVVAAAADLERGE